MPVWLNQNSFLLVAAVTFVAAAIWLLRDGVRLTDVLALGALALGMWTAQVLLRPRAGSSGDAHTIRAEIGAGLPVLVEFQSPY